MEDKEVEDDGFETLFRPIRDAITENWRITLKSFLDKYHDHIKRQSCVNFSEAAIIIQNSMQFYSKRVELLHKEMLNFISSLNTKRSSEELETEGEIAKKGKKKKKNLQSDDFQVLGFIHTDNNVVLDLDRIGKTKAPPKQVILNPSVKIPIKTGTSSVIYQSDFNELGTKHDFRLFWPISSAGLLSEEIDPKGQQYMLGRCSEIDITMRDEHCNDWQQDVDMMEPTLPEAAQTNELTPINMVSPEPPSPLPLNNKNSNHILRKKKIQKRKLRWSIAARKFNRRDVIKIPNHLISIKELGKRRRKNKVALSENGFVTMSKVFLHTACVELSKEGLLLKIQLTDEERFESLIKRRKSAQEECEKLENFDEEDEYNDDNEFNLEDTQSFLAPVPSSAISDIVEEQERVNTYLDTAKTVVEEHHKQMRKDYSDKMDERAKKVAEWHHSIKPALEAAEKRSEFNVHNYGTKILNMFSSDSTRHSGDKLLRFSTITKNQPREEIGRLLLSALVLANTYNVELIKSDKSDLATDCLQLKLLSKERHLDKLNENMEAATLDSQ